MFKSYMLTIITFGLLASSAFSQQIRLSYDVFEESDQVTVKVYMSSLHPYPVEVRAVNFSLALPNEAVFTGLDATIFTSHWTTFLQEKKQVQDLELKYKAMEFNQRLQYGLADPGLPDTGSLMVPPEGDEPLEVLSLIFRGNFYGQVYLEHISENRLNQIGGINFEPIDYIIEHPHREGNGENAGIEAIEQLLVFPNPVREGLTFQVEDALAASYSYTITDLHGRNMMAGKLQLADALKGFKVSVQDYATGTYFVNIINDETGQMMAAKFLKMN